MRLLTDTVLELAESDPDYPLLYFKGDHCTRSEFAVDTCRLAAALTSLGAVPGDRIAVLLPNRPEAVLTAFACFAANLVFVPVNPLLRPRQVAHVLGDCSASILVTTRYLLDALQASLPPCVDTIILADEAEGEMSGLHSLSTLVSAADPVAPVRPAPDEPAIIFYTSGSTGSAKGVLISHRNVVDGARIVSGYLGNTADDRLLATLPLSFDYGFSQVTTAAYSGAQFVLTNYSLPRQLLTEISELAITGMAGVPTMWSQLAAHKWPSTVRDHLRYMTNSGSRLPANVLRRMRSNAPDAQVYLMYGLTEAFRSSYLAPERVDEKPDSIGQAVPEVRLHVIGPDGRECEPGECGELVHAGALVGLGYWNCPEQTARRYRPLPEELDTDGRPAVWSGDIVWRDSDGDLFFVERSDTMLKCSGYRVSPTEIEEVIYASDLAGLVVAVGIADENLGQRIGLAVVPAKLQEDLDFAIRHVCARELPPYMQPDEIIILDELPLTANRKPDRARIIELFNNFDKPLELP